MYDWNITPTDYADDGNDNDYNDNMKTWTIIMPKLRKMEKANCKMHSNGKGNQFESKANKHSYGVIINRQRKRERDRERVVEKRVEAWLKWINSRREKNTHFMCLRRTDGGKIAIKL